MRFIQSPLSERQLTRLFLSIPVVTLAYQALAWLVFGLDLPFFDDWRSYANNTYGSLDWSYLFTPVNDTLSPIGLALNSLAERYLHGNSIAYQFLSMIFVLGGLLYLQWQLIRASQDDNVLAAAAFSLTVFMLQPGSYWGRENLAYNQALPLIGLLAAVHMILISQRPLRVRMAVVMCLGLFSGFSYSSGAVAVLIAACVLLASSSHIEPKDRRSVVLTTLPLLAAGMLTSLAQVYAIVALQADRLQRTDFPVVWPNSADYWQFLLGKVGRALLLRADNPVLSMILVLTISLLVLALAIYWIKHFWRGSRFSLQEARAGIIYLIFLFVIIVYLLMVAFGRAKIRPADIATWQQIFSFGFTRFHFFWVTLLWPWLFIAFVTASRWKGETSRHAALWLVALALLFAAHRGAFRYDEYFSQQSSQRLSTIACLHAEIALGGVIRCEEFDNLNLHDLRLGIALARQKQASFVRYFPEPVMIEHAHQP
jgi:hypothetical protein